MQKSILFIFFALFIASLSAQEKDYGQVVFDGETLTKMVDDNGDTILVAMLEDISVTSPRSFANEDEYRLYRKYRRYAVVVYPYAKEAIRIFRETERATTEMKERQRKKYIKQLQKELKEEFEDPLKKLTKLQGLVLQKMIERETGESLHSSVKKLRGGFTATYWSTFSRFFGYDIKSGYIIGEDKILDAVLDDFDISHDF